jgi:predicted TIM-barrel fold metal-dependent hydrolase
MRIIDAHAHLWLKQNGRMQGRPVISLKNGRSDVGGEVRQMMPPYMVTGENTAEMLLSNMDYAGVSAAVITQEILDGNQNGYLKAAKGLAPDRLKICSYYSDGLAPETEGFDGVKICACKLADPDLTHHARVFDLAREHGLFLAVELADGDAQTGSMLEMIRQYPDVRIAIGHFGMVTRPGWEAQIKLAREKNVYVESGGITWLFHKEFYPYAGAVKAIRTAAGICGMKKLMWGSDYPRTMAEITYKMSFDFILKSNELTPEEKARFLGGTAAAFYGFGDLPEIQPVKNMLED